MYEVYDKLFLNWKIKLKIIPQTASSVTNKREKNCKKELITYEQDVASSFYLRLMFVVLRFQCNLHKLPSNAMFLLASDHSGFP